MHIYFHCIVIPSVSRWNNPLMPVKCQRKKSVIVGDSLFTATTQSQLHISLQSSALTMYLA